MLRVICGIRVSQGKKKESAPKGTGASWPGGGEGKQSYANQVSGGGYGLTFKRKKNLEKSLPTGAEQKVLMAGGGGKKKKVKVAQDYGKYSRGFFPALGGNAFDRGELAIV